MSLNRVTLSGNLTRDPELRTTQSGKPVLKFCIAVNDRRLVNGKWQDYANYIDCIVFGKRADGLSGHLSKGTKVCVDGRLSQSRWEADGKKRSKIEVQVDDLDFMSVKIKEDMYDVDLEF